MSTRAIHVRAAQINCALARVLDEPQNGAYRYWVPTLVLYVAVHVIEARLDDQWIHSGDHRDRIAQLRKRRREWPGAAKAYHDLLDLARQWRYDGTPPTDQDILDAWDLGKAIATACGEPWPTAPGST